MHSVLKQTVDINKILRLIGNYAKVNNKNPKIDMSIETLNDIVSSFNRNCEESLKDRIKIAENALKCKICIDIYGDVKYGEIHLN